MTSERFPDRAAAGRTLGSLLAAYAGRPDVVVLGLARGGVAVARQVADMLGAPLEVFVARKLGVPGIAEVALGAVAEGRRHVVLDPVQWFIGVPRRIVRRIASRQRTEVARRVRLYRRARPLRDLRELTIILVDDGLMTGASLRAAAHTLKKHRPARLVAAVPVAAARSAADLRQEVDELVAVTTPQTLGTVSDWYDDYQPVSDGEVLHLLGRENDVIPLPTARTEIGDERAVIIPGDDCALPGDLGVPEPAPNENTALVILAHGGGSSRHSYRNRYLAGRLRLAGCATLRIDLLSEEETAADLELGELRFDIPRIARRLLAACEWAARERVSGSRQIVLLGASTAAAAALMAAAGRPALVSAVAARGGRVDLAGPALDNVAQPVLLVVGGADHPTLQWNRVALRSLRQARLEVVPGAGHTFEQPGALGAVGEHLVRWLARMPRRDRWRLFSVGQRVMQKKPRLAPIALDGPLGDPAHPGDLGEGVATEKVQVD